MKYFLLTTCILMFALCISGQSPAADTLKAKAKQLDVHKDLIIGYDKFRDRTMVMTKPESLIGTTEAAMTHVFLGGPIPILMANFVYAFSGEQPKFPADQFGIQFTSSNRSWQFLKGDETLYFLIDGERLMLSRAGQDSDIMRDIFGEVSAKETLAYMITRTDLEKIANGKTVEMRIGDTKPREWKDKMLKRIQSMLKLTS